MFEKKLIEACKMGDEEKVIKVLSFKFLCRLNWRDADDHTALIWASKKGHTEIAEILIESGADVNVENNEALISAVKYGHVEIVTMLIKKGTNLDGKGRLEDNALIRALKNGHIEIAKMLIESGADFTVEGNDGCTAYELALKVGYTIIIKILIAKGCDVNKKDERGETFLIGALEKGRTEIAKILIEKGADVNDLNSRGETPLILASKNGYKDIEEMLIEKGADVNRLNEYKTNPIDLQEFVPGNRPNMANITELIAFRKHNSTYINTDEANRYQQWLNVIFEEGWPEDFIQRYHTSMDSSDFEYRRNKIKEILEDQNHSKGRVKVDIKFIKEHLFLDIAAGQKILDIPYYHVAVFKK